MNDSENVEQVGRQWLDLRERLKVLSSQRTELNKQVKALEKQLRAHLETSESQTLVIDGHTIGLVTSVKEQSQ